MGKFYIHWLREIGVNVFLYEDAIFKLILKIQFLMQKNLIGHYSPDCAAFYR